jgi:SMI1 / KNR4 family (SUKH-1)
MAEKHVTALDWKSWLVNWNRELLERIDPSLENRLDRAGITLESHLLKYGVTPEVRASGWLGYPAATEDQIKRLEAHLGKTLPPSYRAFLKVSNGFRQPGILVWRLLPAEEVNWFRVRNQQTIDILKSYGDDLSDTLEISAREIAGSAVYLLNPGVVSADGEWEVIYYAHWQGTNCISYPSFWDLMQKEYRQSALWYERGEGQLNREDDLKTIMTKFPFLIKEFDRKMSRLTNDPYLSGTEWSRDVMTVLETAKSQVIKAQEKNSSADRVIQELEALAVEFREEMMDRARTLLEIGSYREGRGDGIEHGYALAMGSIWWFLNGRHM